MSLDSAQYLSGNLRPQQAPLVRGAGAWVWDLHDKKLLDLSSQTLNLNLGHCHPSVVQAVQRQVEKLHYVSSRFHSEPFLELGRRLVGLAPQGLTHINHKLTNGSDAVETALKIARRHTGRDIILVAHQAWHGETAETLRLCSRLKSRTYLGGSAAVVDVPCDAISAAISSRKHSIAAVLLEPVQVQNGVYCFPDLLRQARDLCTRYRIPLIFDECQTFGGWLDGKLFASDYFGIAPDMLCIGKALSAGIGGLAAVLMKEDFANDLEYNEAEFTYGGQVLPCVAALAALEVLSDGSLNVAGKSTVLDGRLRAVCGAEPSLAVRRFGLIAGIQFSNYQQAERVYCKCLADGVILRRSSHQSTLIIKPPLIVDVADLEWGCDVIAASIKSDNA